MHLAEKITRRFVCILFLVMVAGAAGQPALVRQAPVINGTIEGSVQLLLPEHVELNGGATITGDLLVPGTPTVRLNGRPTYGGTLEGTGQPTPTNYPVTLNGNAALRHVIRRTDPASLPTVVAPPAPRGTRVVELQRAGQAVGDLTTLRDLRLEGGAGAVAVPPGNYGEFKASGRTALVLGVAGATVPAVYGLQRLILEGEAQLQVVGPVVVTVAESVVAGAVVGAPAHPAWLTLNVAAGGLQVEGGDRVYAYVNAPRGLVGISGNGQLVGGVACDRLTVQGSGVLRLLPAVSANQPPTVRLTAPADGASLPATSPLVLRATATDPDGIIARVEFLRGTLKLGESTIAPYEWSVGVLPAGSHTFAARATDDRGATADSAPVTITLTNLNQPPTVGLTAPADGTLLTAPASVTLAAVAADADGAVVRVEFYQGATLVGQATSAPYTASLAGLAAGTYAWSARAIDNQGAATASAVATVTVVNPNLPPTVTLTATRATLVAPASFVLVANALDADGTVTRTEFFQGSTRLGEDTVGPFEHAVSGLPAGQYTFTARAHDNQGGATDSAPLSLTVISPNLPPQVTLAAPADGAIYGAPATVTLSATASDPDGTVARVEFFAGATPIGETASAPFTLTWAPVPPGTYTLTARAYDNLGASAVSAPRTLTVLAVLPYFADFEAAEGFAPGSLAGQAGWAASGGVIVADMPAARGSRAVLLPAATPVAQAARAFPPYAEQTVVFVDAYVRPAAAANAEQGQFWRDDVARVALVQAGGQGELHVFAGDGAGGGAWQATGSKVTIAADGQALAWMRVTLREDFGAAKWDLYVGGALVAADLGFRDRAAPRYTQFAINGHATAATALDDFYAGFENPIFADADRDGMDDAWEVRHGLDPTRNDRDADRDGDGLSNLREYRLGTRPDAADSDGDGLSDGWEVANGTRPLSADAGADPDGDGLTNQMEAALGSNPLRPASADTTGALRLRLFRPGF